MQNIKSTIYWIEVTLTLIFFCLGVGLTLMLITYSDYSFLEAIDALSVFAFYLLQSAIDLLSQEPVILLMTILWFSLYFGTLFYFSQTKTEKRFLVIVIPVSLAAVLFFSIGIFGIFLSELASQGAGH